MNQAASTGNKESLCFAYFDTGDVAGSLILDETLLFHNKFPKRLKTCEKILRNILRA